MPERSFFDIRHAIPGYTFILSFIFQNLVGLALLSTRIAESDSIALLGIFFGFITLLSGAALGFLVSQPWYLLLNIAIKRGLYYFVNKDKTGEKLSVSRQDYKVLNYEKKEVRDYIFRRWDLFNLMGSVIFALTLGTLLGWLLNSAFIIPPDRGVHNYFYLFLQIDKQR